MFELGKTSLAGTLTNLISAWIHPSSVWYKFNLPRLRAHSIWMGRWFGTKSHPPISMLPTRLSCVPVFRFNFKKSCKIEFFWSGKVVTYALFRHKSQLKWNFSALPSLLCKLHKIVNFVFGWVRNIAKIKIVPLCSIGYSIIHLFRLFVICLQSSLSLSYLFKLLEQRLFLS